MTDFKQWQGFEGRIWKEEVNTRDFIQKNYRPYNGDESFLAGPTEATDKLWGALQKLQKEERAKGGVLDMETEVVSGLTAYGPGYIDPELKELEEKVGFAARYRRVQQKLEELEQMVIDARFECTGPNGLTTTEYEHQLTGMLKLIRSIDEANES